MTFFKRKSDNNHYISERKIRNTFTSNYQLAILSKLHQRYRPKQIAKYLDISPQLVNYHMDKLNDLNLIEKIGNRNGISWNLTERGYFILKEFMTGSVNRCNPNGNAYFNTRIPVRLHQLTFAFRIDSSLSVKDLNLEWKNMRNGVSKKTIIKKISEEENTVEIVKSPNDGKSVLLVHIHGVHTFNVFKEIIRLYEAARNIAYLVAEGLGIEIFSVGELIKKPHLAFESDLISLYLASYERASITTSTKKGEAWIDESHGIRMISIMLTNIW